MAGEWVGERGGGEGEGYRGRAILSVSYSLKRTTMPKLSTSPPALVESTDRPLPMMTMPEATVSRYLDRSSTARRYWEYEKRVELARDMRTDDGERGAGFALAIEHECRNVLISSASKASCSAAGCFSSSLQSVFSSMSVRLPAASEKAALSALSSVDRRGFVTVVGDGDFLLRLGLLRWEEEAATEPCCCAMVSELPRRCHGNLIAIG